METSSPAHEKVSACQSLVCLNHFKIAVSLKAGQPQGRTRSSLPLGDFAAHLQASPIRGAKDWFALGCL